MPQKPLTLLTDTKPGTTANSYTTGQTIGAAQKIALPSIANGENCLLASLVLVDPDSQNCAIDVFFFDNNPTVTDHTTFAPKAAEVKGCVGRVNLSAANYVAVGASGSFVQAADQQLALPNTFWLVLVARGSATYTANSLHLRLGLRAD